MRQTACLLGLCAVVLVSSGCSIKHHIARDYGEYLAKNQGKSSLPRTTIKADYLIGDATKTHRYEFRAVTVGYANLWILDFGEILDATLRSEDIQRSFGRLLPISSPAGSEENFIIFELQHYEYIDYRARAVLNITWTHDDKEMFTKTYSSVGKEQSSKMWIGGVFAMRNAVQQSTKYVIDHILRQFIDDVNWHLSN